MDEEVPIIENQDGDTDDYRDVCPKTCGSSIACDPTRKLHKFILLPVMCLLNFGSYFCYDNPASLQDRFYSDMDMSPPEYTLLYSLYSWPNVVLSVVGGFLIDGLLGIRLGAIVFALFILLGQVILSVGAFVKSIIVLYIARFVFGMGGESLAVAQNVYASSWFADSELNFVFGLQLSMARIGSTFSLNVMYRIYDRVSQFATGHTALGWSLLLACFTCIISLLFAMILAFFDWRQKRILHKRTATTGEKIQLMDILKFPFPHWLICTICVLFYGAVFPFVSVALVFFERKYKMTAASANLANSLIYLISVVASPIVGFCIDRVGRNLIWLQLGVIMAFVSHAIFAFTQSVPPFAVVILFGLSYSVLASALWPLVVFVVPLHQRATAFGVMQAIQNLGLAIVNTITGIIIDKYGYFYLEAFFMLCLSLTLMVSTLLHFWDVSHDTVLNASAKTRYSKAQAPGTLIDES